MNGEVEYIAYDGDAYTVEWYFNDGKKSLALEYYQELSVKEKIKVLKLFKRIGDSGEIKDITKFRNEGNKIYSFKPKPDRFLCFFYDGGKIVVTNAFKKKQQKLPKNEHEKATKLREDYILRVENGVYYEEKNIVNF